MERTLKFFHQGWSGNTKLATLAEIYECGICLWDLSVCHHMVMHFGGTCLATKGCLGEFFATVDIQPVLLCTIIEIKTRLNS